MTSEDPVILSLGGSLIVPNGGIDTDFLKKFNNFIREKVAQGRHFFIVCGGGATCRHYQEAGQEVMGHKLTYDDLDWIGVHTTRLNAHLLRTIFRDIAHRIIVHHYDKKHEKATEPVIIAAGWKPGWSTDYCATNLAKYHKANLLINMSNVKMVYDKDPKKFPEAKPIKAWNWQKYRKLVGDLWIPGMNIPFDPIAAKLAEEIKLKVIILDGKDLTNLERCLSGKNFIGTTIS